MFKIHPEHMRHGSARLTAVRIDGYNAEIKAGNAFLGDQASGRAFRAILESSRKRAKGDDADPVGKTASKDISKKTLDRLLLRGDVLAAGVVLGTIEEFSLQFAGVIRRFMRLEAWRATQRIVVGGGLRASRIGELAIGRTAVLLRNSGLLVDLIPIHSIPDEAGLLGCTYLASPKVFSAYDAHLAVDIGGANIRVGLIKLERRKGRQFITPTVAATQLWRHADDRPGRTAAVDGLVDMLAVMIRRARKRQWRLAPFIGIGCPGVITKEGSIKKGAQNLPGDWEHASFNLPRILKLAIPKIDTESTIVVMHNDAVVQGLSEVPFMRDVRRWGVMTIGTGLGNARFTNRATST